MYVQTNKGHDMLSRINRCLLELLLRRRGGAVIALLTRASKAAPRADVEDALRYAVVTVQKTIVDVHAIFAPGPNGRCMLVELAHLSSNGKGRLQMPAPEIKRLCTKWLSLLAPKIREFSKRLLGAAVDTNTLARIRGALWTITHGKCAWASTVPGKRRAREEVTDEILWTEAASFTVDVSALGSDAHPGGNTAAPRLDLWSLLFSNTFADLAEALLRESLICIRQDVECRLDSILLAITGNQAGAGAQDGSNGLAAHSPRRPLALMAHDILAAADAVVSLLKSELRSLAGDAWCLTERGDKAAADALRTSFYLLCVEMAAGLANHLRTALEEIHDCIKSASQQERRGIPCEGGLRELEDTLGSFADAGLVIGRVAWMLNGRGGHSLSYALTAPACFARRLRGRIEEQQLEAAFVIADTDGDGIVDADEAAEALQAVSFGASAALVLDPSPYPSFTLSEFFLFATRLLEEQRPHVHFTTCLDDMLATSLTVWAEWALERTATLLTEGCDALAALCGNPAMTDDAWRQAHGIWEDKTIELDRDDGDGIEETVHVPIMVSPAILCYIEGVAAELGRILSIADLVGPASVSEPQGAKAAKDEARTIGGVALGDSTGEGAARYARSLAAVRASSDLMHALVALCEGPQAPATQACEAALLQLLLDALFLQRWVADADRFTSSMDSVVATLSEMIDPINLQIYLPHLQTAAAACWAACHTPLSLIFQGVVAHCTATSGISMSPDGAVGSSSSFVALVPKARRFELLPLPLDVVRLQDANGSSRVGNSVGRKPGGAAEADGTGSSAQVRGMEAGRQALAGLMDQVGSVGSVLSAQNVKVQSVFGAASLFLGGRNRRGDGDEDRVF